MTMARAERGGPGGKYLGGSGPMTGVELREARADLLDQLAREPEVLHELEAAVLAGDLATLRHILEHLHDLFGVLAAWVQCTMVGADPPSEPTR